MEWNEEQAQKLLNKLKQDPNFELMQEYGRLLMKHINSFTPEERRRYDEFKELLKIKHATD